MTQFQFDTILKIIEQGAPVLYNDLANSLHAIVVERNNLIKENEDLRAQVEDLKAKVAQANSCDAESEQPDPVCEEVSSLAKSKT